MKTTCSSLLPARVAALLVYTALTLSAGANTAADLLETAGISGGLVVHLGCGDGTLTAALRATDRYLVHGLDTDPANVARAREHVRACGQYGPVSVDQLRSPQLPYVDNLINLLVVSDPECDVPAAELMRVLAPRGVLLDLTKPTERLTTKPVPADMDQWTHYLHDPSNNAVADDSAIGPPRSLRWTAPPRWGRTHEEFASMSAMVSANGRLFSILDTAPLISLWYPPAWKLVARDAFNGTKLWDVPIPSWNDHLRHFRSGPVHLPRRLVAVGDDVFVTLGFDAPVTRLDAATGEVRHTYKGTERTEEIVCHNGVLYLMIGTSETKRSGKGLSQRGEPKPSTARFLVALTVDSGRELWRKNARGSDYILPLSVTALGTNAFYQTIRGVVCVDARNGTEKWLAPRETPEARYGWSTSTLVVTEDIVLCADRKVGAGKKAKAGPATTDLNWGVTCFDVPFAARRGVNELIAYSATDGSKLWSAPCAEGYNAPVDVFVIDNTVWLGAGFTQGYDLKTGTVRHKFSVRPQPVGMVHARCYRNKASSNFIFTCRDGIEVIDLDKGWIGNNSWVRGTCQYGIMPCNGMLYATPDACGCHPKARLQGFNALSAALPKSATGKPVSAVGRLLKGPAYGSTAAATAHGTAAWPMYRRDSRRSGAASAAVPASLKPLWTASIGGHLTQPVVADGKLFVASINTHTLHAISAADGSEAWRYTAGSRIDSAPTLWRGKAVFGSADGWVTCLNQTDGRIVWRFHAAPEQRLIAVNGRLESAWPVHGSVLVQNEELVFTAGRSSYLDGGIYLYRLNPMTGEMLGCSIISHLDPVTGKQTAQERRGSFDSEGVATDLLSSDGESIFLKHMCFDASGKESAATKPHLFSPGGFLGEEWFIRTFWLYGTNTGAGYGRWASMKSGKLNIAPAGRIMSFDDDRIYGYGRKAHASGWTGHRGDAHHLFASVKVYAPPKQPAGKGKRPARPKKTFAWSQASELLVRAMVLTPEHLIVAGPPSLVQKHKDGLSFSNPDEGLAALQGKKGGVLNIVARTDGGKLSSLDLASPPVFDGMSAAYGRLFVAAIDGSVTCYGGNGK